MELFIAILLLLGLNANPEKLNDPDFQSINQTTIDHAKTIIQNNEYKYDQSTGIIIIEDGTGDKP